MPLYEYQCGKCQKIFEVRATIKEKEAGLQPVCPGCHATQTHQVISAGMFVRALGGGSSMSGCGPGAGPGCCG